MYARLMKRGFRDVFSHPNIFLPDIFGLLMTFAIGWVAFYFSGLDFLLQDIKLGGDDVLNGLSSYFFSGSGDIARVLFSLIGFFITTFLIGAGLQVAKYGMFKDMLNNKKPGFFRSLFRDNKKYYWKFIGMKIAVYLTFALGFIVALLFGLLFIGFSKIFAAWAFAFAFALLFIYLMLNMFFVFPILFLDEKGIKESMRMSFGFVRDNRKIAFYVFLISLLLYGGFFLATTLSLLPVKDFSSFYVAVGAVIGLIPIVIVGDFPFLPPLFQWQAGYFGFLSYKQSFFLRKKKILYSKKELRMQRKNLVFKKETRMSCI